MIPPSLGQQTTRWSASPGATASPGSTITRERISAQVPRSDNAAVRAAMPDAPVMALIGGVRVTPLRQQQPPIRRIDQSLDNLSLPALTQTTPPSLPRTTWDEAEPVMRV